VKVSTIITTRNRTALLRQAIESALAQEPCGAAVEIIVVDDDSTDDTAAVVASYPIVQYLHTRQGTCGGSRNAGIAHAQGDWIAILDDDDVWLPNKLKIMCELIAANPRARLIYSAVIVCDFQLNRDWTWSGPNLHDSPDAYDAFLDVLPCPSAVMLHRDIFAQVGLFDTYAPRAEDRDMWFRVLQAGFECAAAPEPLVLYRHREKMDGELMHKSYADTMAVLRRYFAAGTARRPTLGRRLKVYWDIRGWYAHQLMYASRQAAGEGDRRLAARFRRVAFGMSPAHSAKSALRAARHARRRA